MFYKRKNAATAAKRKGTLCKKCRTPPKSRLERSCPQCAKLVTYTTVGSLNYANKNNSLCCKCAKSKKEKREFKIKCFSCENNIWYFSLRAAKNAEKEKRNCEECRSEVALIRKNITWKRNCYICNKELIYKNKSSWKISEDNNSPCRNCSKAGRFYSGNRRRCPVCNKELIYKSIDSATNANKHNSVCKNCSLKGIRPSDLCIQKGIEANTGKKHSKEHLQKRKNTLNRKYNSDSYFQSKAYKDKMFELGLITLLHGKTPHYWAEQYNVAKTAIYHWIKLHPNPTKEELITFCKNYKKGFSDIENIIANEFNLKCWDKKFDKGKYPDLLYRPDFKLSKTAALNVDGLYWHSNERQKDNKYHYNMRIEYEKRKLRIFQFREDEVKSKLPIIRSIINNNLNKTSIRIGARKCTIKKVAVDQAKEFLNKNHIKGYKASNHVGLYYKENLVCLMSYMYQNNKNGRYLKIDRFCSIINTNVMGGFSKLLSWVENNTEKLSVYYWVDLRYGTGAFLLNHRFVLEKETLGWEWTDFSCTYNRLSCRANMDERRLSQRRHAEELGWYKIYDAGQRLYIKH